MLAEKFANIDLSSANPIPAIIGSPRFQNMVNIFADRPAIKDALVSPDAQALLYSLIRLLRPDTVVEIGTYRASTTEAMARAIVDNGKGTLHTIDPFGAETVPTIIGAWPKELQNITKLHLVDSMMFFAEMQKKGERSDLIFIDGNHDYEYALFDIQCAARLMNAGGFIVIDNIAQPGPFFAAQDFMKRAAVQGWTECGNSLDRYRQGEVFDKHRTTTHNTDFCILRAPLYPSVGDFPTCFGELPWVDGDSAIDIKLAEPATGVLNVQFIIRIFENPPREIIETSSVSLKQEIDIAVPIRFPSGDGSARRTVEPWLIFEGAGNLRLRELPAVH